MADTKTLRNRKRRQAIIRLMIMALILICINILASFFHSGIDLTREKRFTLTTPTRRLLSNMKEVAVIDVYMKGKFPADMQRMQEAVREQLAAFKSVAGNKVVYRFTDPLEGKSDKDKRQVVKDLKEKGIEYMELPTTEEEGYSVKICFPFALLQYNGKEMPIALLENPPGKNREEQIVYATAMLEYKFASAINMLSQPTKHRIAYAIGHGEDVSVHSVDMLSTLSQLYDLDSLNLGRLAHISNAYDAIIINQPSVPFTDPEKLKIDQYVMRGGHIFWVVNTMTASMDSFSKGSQKFLSLENGLNLDDLMFKYGVRINNNLVEDYQNIKIPLMNNVGKLALHDWPYFPKINPSGEHPIIRNMNFIMGGFTNTMDTILTASLKKTILLTTSKYSRVSGAPATVSLTKAYYPGTPANFNKSYQNVAVLSEGTFHSLFEHRLAPSYLAHLDSINERFIPVANKPTSMIFASIGGLLSNDFSTKDGPLSLGYDKYSGSFFANKNFLLNGLEYLTDPSGILEARSKDVKVRLLDKARIADEKVQWQWINVGIPIALVLIFASCYQFFRSRKYDVRSKT